ANEEAAQSLTASIISAEAEGLSSVGLSHFIDYLEALEAGRIDDLAKAAKLFGVAIFSQKNAYTCGALGYFTGRLAAQGLVSF
ncbi:Ldh family oxidoreductase, partial [Mesorhizobium sp. M7A.F.Ca.CA.002.11.2.1]